MNHNEMRADQIASANGHTEVSQYLANLCVTVAIDFGNYHAAYYPIFDGAAEVDHRNDQQFTTLLALCSAEEAADDPDAITIARNLIEWGADINAVERDGWSCLRFAAARRDERLVEFLLEAGATDYSRAAQTAADVGANGIVDLINAKLKEVTAAEESARAEEL